MVLYPVCPNYPLGAKIGPTPGVTRDMASFQQIPYVSIKQNSGERFRATCSDIKGRLNATPDYVCPRCLDQARPIDGRPITQVEVDGRLLDVEASFCYLGDMLSAGGGCTLAIATRCSTAWGKFRKLLPILTSRHVSPLTCGKVFSAFICSALLHGSETWAPTAPGFTEAS